MEKAAKLLGSYCTFLRALYLIHQTSHWQTTGYDKHLLFERLYKNVQKRLDEAAEKTIGLYGTEPLNLGSNAKLLNDLTTAFSPEKHDSCVATALKAELQFIKTATSIYNALKGNMSLGLDDMLMSHISEAETRVYLLKQSA